MPIAVEEDGSAARVLPCSSDSMLMAKLIEVLVLGLLLEEFPIVGVRVCFLFGIQ